MPPGGRLAWSLPCGRSARSLSLCMDADLRENRCNDGDCSHNDSHETVPAHGAQHHLHQKLKKETAQELSERDNHGSMGKYQMAQRVRNLSQKNKRTTCAEDTQNQHCPQVLLTVVDTRTAVTHLSRSGMARGSFPPGSGPLAGFQGHL